MHILKKDDGFTLIESLVSLVILGISFTCMILFFNIFFRNPKIYFKNEALYLAKQEVERTVNYRIITDTVYTNRDNNLTVKRSVEKTDSLFKAEITVLFTSTKDTLQNLSVKIR